MKKEIHQVKINTTNNYIIIYNYICIVHVSVQTYFYCFNIVIELTSKNFYHKLAKKKSKVMWIIDYFASWCGPCQRLAPEWIIVAKTLKALPFINVASVDCEAEASLCISQGVRSYPNIRMYPLDSEGLSTIA